MAQGRSTVAVGFAYFAAIMMMIVGIVDILQGFAAIVHDDYYVVGATISLQGRRHGLGMDPPHPRHRAGDRRLLRPQRRAVGSHRWHHRRLGW